MLFFRLILRPSPVRDSILVVELNIPPIPPVAKIVNLLFTL